MRVFVLEYITGGGLARQPLPASLAEEGDRMLQALVRDLARLPDMDVVISRDTRLDLPALPARSIALSAVDDSWAVWDEQFASADAVWPIAPETDGVLARICERIQTQGRLLIASDPHAIRIAASKQATADTLRLAGLPVVPTVPTERGVPDDSGYGWVLKPDDGVGCSGAQWLPSRSSLERAIAACENRGRWVVQPYLPGVAASLSMLCCEGDGRLLSVNVQHVRCVDGRFDLKGISVGGLPRSRAYDGLAAGIARAVPGLRGYIGADLIITASGPVILEVNPRLTSSYTDLQTVMRENPAAVILSAFRSPGSPNGAGAHASMPGRIQ